MRPTLLPFALLIVVTGLLYLPTLTYPAVYEDLNDPETLFAAPSLSAYIDRLLFRPTRALTEISFAVNRQIAGAEALWGYHAGNVLIHLVNVALVALVAWPVFPPVAALAAATIFAVHPLNVEAVAYVSARADLVAALGLLLALCATSAGSFAGALCGVLFAALGKETALVAWGLVPLWATWVAPTFPVKRWLWTGVPLAVLAAVVAWRLDLSLWPTGLQLALTNASIWRLLALFPVPLGLSIDHDWHALSRPMLAFAVTLSAAAGFVVLTAWKRSWWALALAWTAISLAPRFLVSTHEGLHEHHLVMPMIGWCLCAGAWLTSLEPHPALRGQTHG